ncbi:MAG: F0F1 ATP synthase subunit B [Gammaproteobacteria bacterium]|nr:F0F1 ATP synthase subunit B [Gammaproteobacteria bacterium]
MIIDWFTVCAQILNFLILIWLLNRFLYKPILNAIDEREYRIASQLEEAARIKAEAQRERLDFEQKNIHFEQQRSQQFKAAIQHAESERQKLIEQARQETADLKQQWLETLSCEQTRLNQHLRQRIEQEVFNIARKTLHDLSSTELEDQITTVFIHHLHTQARQLNSQFNTINSRNSAQAIIRSQFTLSENQQSAIKHALNDITQQPLTAQFENSLSRSCGIECVIGSHKISWTLDDYLDSMESVFGDLMQETVTNNTTDATTESANTH